MLRKLLLIFNDVIEELAAVCILHNQENVLLRLNNLIVAVLVLRITRSHAYDESILKCEFLETPVPHLRPPQSAPFRAL